MKKIYLSLICLMMGVSSVLAQGTVVFTDGKDGEVIADGATITRTHVTEDIALGNYIHSGLYMKNTATSGGAYVSIEMKVEQISGGIAQICFPTNCISHNSVGTYETKQGAVQVGKPADIQSEWLIPNTYGQCKVKYTIKNYNYKGKDQLGAAIFEFAGNGASVTVIYDYADPAGINGVEADKDVASVSYYSLLGQKLPVAKGLCIKKTTFVDGTQKCVKIVVR